MILNFWKKWPTELMTWLSYMENNIVTGDTVHVQKQVMEMPPDV